MPDALPMDASSPMDAGGPDAPEPSLPEPPALLSEAGLFAGAVGGELVSNALAYDVRFPLWTDGIDKHRYLVLPPGGTIDTSDPDNWSFPVGTRVFKQFVTNGRAIEMRLLWKAGPLRGDWVHVAYRYREDGSDADVLPNGEADALGSSHDIPSVADCFNCHRGTGDFVIGIGALQLSREDHESWVQAGILAGDAPWDEPPGNETQRAALGYLHGNCGHCHGGTHPIATLRDLRLRLYVGLTDPYEAPAWRTSVDQMAGHDIGGTRTIVRAGDPEASQLYIRMGLRSELGMPPIGTETVDNAAQSIIESWIRE